MHHPTLTVGQYRWGVDSTTLIWPKMRRISGGQCHLKGETFVYQPKNSPERFATAIGTRGEIK